MANITGTNAAETRNGTDRIIYETDTGKLLYDSNGSAAGGPIQFATLAPNLGITNADFFVV